ncbi:terminase large subunit [Rhizobium phage P9VFCI]|uniref:Terminase large subunit n=2 Tax=Innesvirus TaxID=3044739 RepID=A0A7G7WX45_9CAUD|nr:terminase large subunit [Rhizobium phage P9VFCI]YP_010662296.1 terminase large subunit [Rhizobium phage AF3]QNH71374.1 terminase large subunit [Rhizobium phage AF3]QNH71789.1 terminase large subunit [Rhizobium phage P9VFCI]
MQRFEKLDTILDALNPRFQKTTDKIDLNYRFDPADIPDIVDPTQYGARNYYKNNKLIKRSGTPVQFTPAMQEELKRCALDILYFAEKYFFVRTLDYGKIKIPLRDYQKFWLRVSEEEDIRQRIWLACRQSGKSSTLTIEILHKVLFNDDYQIAILANKGGTAREIFSRVRLAYEMLPFWLQVGVVEWNKGSMELENGSKVFAASTSSDSIRGFTLNEIILDEMCFVKNDEEFMTSTYPVIASGKKSRITMISTPNGPRGEFHKNWQRAVKGKNSYYSFKVPWHFVPGRDAEWKQNTIENTSYTQFRQEQDVEFVGHGDGFLNAETLEMLAREIREPLRLNDPELSEQGFEIFELPQEGHAYIACVDNAEGKEQDESTISIIDITEKPFKLVGTFADNRISPLLFPHKIKKMAEIYNNAMTIVENNTIGLTVAVGLYLDLEYENVYLSNNKDETGIGVRTTRPLKQLGCANLRSLLEKGAMKVPSQKVLHQLQNFVPKNGTYNAAPGHKDDLVANLWMFGWYTSQGQFEEFLKNKLVQELYSKEIEETEAMSISVDRGNTHRSGNHNSFW